MNKEKAIEYIKRAKEQLSAPTVAPGTQQKQK